jgi:phosphoribosylformylglycinamidine synthase
MIHRIEIAIRKGLPDPRGKHVAARVRDFLDVPITAVRTRDVYHLEADLSADEVARVVSEFADPVLNVGAAGRIDDGGFDTAITVAYKPGVADPVGKSARIAIQDILGRDLGDGAAVYTSVMYLLDGVDRPEADRIAFELLANSVIQTARVLTFDEWQG